MAIALIGAGAAGAACVSVLRSRGAEFSIFEKSRGVGGRLTTRRVSGVLPAGELAYDHGAAKFSLNDTLIHALSGSIGESTLQPFAGEYVAQPTMPQLVKDLLGSAKINTLTEIERLRAKPVNGGW
jgi:predicted NAD/FAD-dependent oxidoreductase